MMDKLDSLVCSCIFLYDIHTDIRKVESYSKISMPILQVDAQFTVVEAALKGYMKWRMSHSKISQEDVSIQIPASLCMLNGFRNVSGTRWRQILKHGVSGCWT